jgi:hypothetical protein
MGRLEDILFEMFRVYRAGNKYDNPKVQLARKWTEENDWSVVCQQWIDLFTEVEDMPREVETEEGDIKGMLL